MPPFIRLRRRGIEGRGVSSGSDWSVSVIRHFALQGRLIVAVDPNDNTRVDMFLRLAIIAMLPQVNRGF